MEVPVSNERSRANTAFELAIEPALLGVAPMVFCSVIQTTASTAQEHNHDTSVQHAEAVWLEAACCNKVDS